MTTVVGYRVADWDTPLWISPNRSPTRWGTSGAIVQYWSTHPLTPWAEFCDPAAGRAVVLDDLLRHIRWRGDVHAGLEAWHLGAPPPLPPAVRTPAM